jgi:hypothetical protein
MLNSVSVVYNSPGIYSINSIPIDSLERVNEDIFFHWINQE